MTRALALALTLAAPAHAGDTAPGAHLWPEEPEYRVWIDAEVIAPLWHRCGPDAPCSVAYQREPDPAPVPLPPTPLLSTAAIAALIWKGSNRV